MNEDDKINAEKILQQVKNIDQFVMLDHYHLHEDMSSIADKPGYCTMQEENGRLTITIDARQGRFPTPSNQEIEKYRKANAAITDHVVDLEALLKKENIDTKLDKKGHPVLTITLKNNATTLGKVQKLATDKHLELSEHKLNNFVQDLRDELLQHLGKFEGPAAVAKFNKKAAALFAPRKEK